MRLLVSVRSAEEARVAAEGGAVIIDAKEPDRGSLGQVDADVLHAITAAVPAGRWVSAALGDVASVDDVARALDAVTVPVRFVKLAFRGITDARDVERLLREAVRRCDGHEGRPRVIAVAYGDHVRAETVEPRAVCALAQAQGSAGLLLDTCLKDQRSLFDFVDLAALAPLGSLLARDELEFALAGHLGAGQLGLALEAGATIFGVRGAVCDPSGRTGMIVAARVRELAESLRFELSRV